jgi:hypothetical protein
VLDAENKEDKLSDETTPKAAADLGRGSNWFVRFARRRRPRFRLSRGDIVAGDRDILKFITVPILPACRAGELLSLVHLATGDLHVSRDIPATTRLDFMGTKEEHSRSRSSTGEHAMSNFSALPENSRYEQACDQAIAMCNGNLRSTIKALIMANEYLEAELEELQTAIAAGCAPADAPRARSNAA